MNRRKQIAVAGSAANPPTRGHREFAETLTRSGKFDLVLWVPTGARPDKPELIDPIHRVRMTELVFNREWQKKQPTEFRIDLRDVYRTNTPTIHFLREIQKEYSDAEIIFATGVDVLVPLPEYGGKCEVAHHWYLGESLMKNWTFAVFPRGGYPSPKIVQEEGKMPPCFIILDGPRYTTENISSTDVRRKVAHGEPVDDQVDLTVAEYIRAHKLYQ